MEEPDLPIDGFDSHQKELARALGERSKSASNIYAGAMLTLKQANNPDRISLAAHGIRELINLLPKFIDVPIVKEARQQLGQFADPLVEEWQKMKDGGRWPGQPEWIGEIDGDLRGVLQRTAALVDAHTNIREGRRIQTKEIIRKHNFSAIPLPGQIEELRTKEWENYRNFFVGCAHHKNTTESDFLSYLTHFEYLLLNYLKPRTFEDYAAIQEIISEAQRGN